MSVMTRLLWKELRTQGQLWLAMLAGVFLLSLTLTLTSTTPSSSLSDPLIGLVYVLTAGFAAASAAVLFAGESEEGQADWLRRLPMKTSQLINSKVGFGALATVLLLVASYSVAAFVARWQGFSLRPQFVPAASSLLCIAGCFIWGLFYSAQMSRVLAVIAAAAFTTLVLQAMLNQLIHDAVYCDVVHAGILLMVAAVSRALLWHWHRNQVIRERTVAATPTAGHSLRALPLRWLITAGPLEFRRWTVLIWKECYAALPMALVTFFILAATTWATAGFSQTLLLPTVIILFGLRVFRSDSRENAIAFLSDRGVPAARLWLIKISVWLSAAVLTIGGCLLWQQLTVELGLADRRQLAFPDALKVSTPYIRLPSPVLDPSLQAARASDSLRTIWSLAGALFLALFAIGQAASFWVRRTILTFAAASLGGVLLILWALSMTARDIPPVVTVWPAAVLLLAATFDTRRFWMEQRTGWPLRRRQLIWILLPVVLCPVLALLSRGWQVPQMQPGFDWQQYSTTWDGLDREWTNRWQNAATARISDSRNHLTALLDDLSPGRQIDPLLMSSITGADRTISVRSLIDRLSQDYPLPSRPEEEPQLELLSRQLEHLKTSLKGVRYLAGQTSSWEDFETCLQAETILLAMARAWSASQHQTVELLDDALLWLHEGTQPSRPFSIAESFQEMVKRRYVLLRGLYTGEGRIGTTIDHQLMNNGRGSHWFLHSFLGTPERNRVLNLLNWATSADLNMPLASLPELQQFRNRPGVWAAGEFDYQRYAMTTLMLPPELQTAPAVATREVAGISNQQLAMLRVVHSRAISVVAIGLQRERLLHGQFPESLDELTDSPVPMPVDPVWDAPFLFTKADNHEQAFKTIGRFIPGQPMLAPAREQDFHVARRTDLALDDWESRMQLRPDRVLVLPFADSLNAANANNWPSRPEPELPAGEGMFDQGSEGGMEGMPGMEMNWPRPKARQLPIPPFDV